MTNIQTAIKFAENEIKSLELAPKINGCEMKEWWKKQIEIWETAISALEKQTPKKVSVLEMPCENIYSCPNCHNVFSNCHSAIPHGKYCSNCGQALDFNSNGSDTE